MGGFGGGGRGVLLRAVIASGLFMFGTAVDSRGQDLVRRPVRWVDAGGGRELHGEMFPAARFRAGQEPERATGWRIAAQIAGGFAGAAAAGLGAWSLLDDPEGSDRRVKGDEGYTPNANTAYAAASFVGSTLAVYLIGRGDGSRGSLAATALGTGVASAVLFLGRHEPYLPLLGLVFGAPLQAVGGTVGYQRSR